MPTTEERLAALEKQMAAWIDQQPTNYYTHQYSGEEIDAAVGRALAGGALDTSVTNVSNQLGTFVRPNLLDNWYFGNPVNQRGQTEYSAAGYTIDRWKMQLDIGIITTTADGLILDATANALTLVQFFESDLLRELAGNTLTWAVMYTVLEQSGAPGGIGYTIPGSYYAQAIMAGDVGKLCVASGSISAPTNLEIPAQMYIPKGCKIKLIAAKLELGSTQTLAHREGDRWVLNEVPEYGEQLRRCQRYALLSQEIMESVPMCTGFIFVPTPVTMRSKPVIVGAPSVWRFENNAQIPDATVSVNSVMPNGVLLFTTATVPAYLLFHAGTGLSADL